MIDFEKERELRLSDACEECRIHDMRLRHAEIKISPFFPLTKERYESLTEDDIEHIDQMLYRFSKLQDAMGERTFPALLEWLEEDIKPMTTIDRLNRLEEIGALAPAEFVAKSSTYNGEDAIRAFARAGGI